MSIAVQTGLIVIIGGFSAGVINGLLGTGGGIVIVFLMSYLLRGKVSDRKDIYANAIAAVLPISLISLILYIAGGKIQDAAFGKYVIPAIVGGVLGGLLLEKINVNLLKKIFSLLVIYSGFSMIFK